MLQASAEGTAFEIAKGRYSESANFDVYLKGHAGDHLRVGRMGRDGEIVDEPALSVALTVQPDVIRCLAEEASMRGRGYLARFFYGLPKSRVGNRKVKPAPIPQPVSDTYHANMRELWQLTEGMDEDGKPAPIELRFSAGADKKMEEFEAELEPQLAEGKPLSCLAGWANKLAGGVARIAGILHMAAGAGKGCDASKEISVQTVEAAIRIGKDYLIPHAKAVFSLMGTEPRVDDARRILRWLEQREPTRFSECLKTLKGGSLFTVSRSEAHAEVFGGSRSVEEIDPAIGLLVGYGYLRPIHREDQRQGPGRKPSQRFAVNPHVRQPK